MGVLRDSGKSFSRERGKIQNSLPPRQKKNSTIYITDLFGLVLSRQIVVLNYFNFLTFLSSLK